MKTQLDFLILMAIGDAYGMKYEFVPHEQNATSSDLFYGPHPKHTDYSHGNYTDDTQMALAIAELLIKKSSTLSTISEADFIESWLETFHRDPHVGYSRYMFKVISESHDVEEFLKNLNPSGATSSGAAMRAGPIGLLSNVEDVKRLTKLQAAITHNTPTGISAALAVSLTVHFLHHGGDREKLPEFLTNHIGENWATEESGYCANDPRNALKIVMQAIHAFQGAETLSEVLLNAVNQEPVSDTDTVCSLAMIMASRCPHIKNDLPDNLYTNLENGSFGADYLQKIDKDTEKLFPASTFYKNCVPSLSQKKITPPQHP